MAEKILLVDDEPELCFLISKFLRLNGYEVITAESPEQALKAVKDDSLRLIILDVVLADLGGKDGSNLVGELKSKHPRARILLYTGLSKEDKEVQDMLNLGAYQYLSKGAPLETLLKAVQNADTSHAKRERAVKSKRAKSVKRPSNVSRKRFA